jgi:AraC family transcriptional regulator of adaptative response/methylated-DNA-[protein]-cysteine methyltransferase
MMLETARTRCRLGWVGVVSDGSSLRAVYLADRVDALDRQRHRDFPRARWRAPGQRTQQWLATLAAFAEGHCRNLDIPVRLHGTAFQRRVWRALRRIPYGQTWSYARLARAIGHPRAVRAVAQACAANPVPLLVPCHRVIRSDGSLGGYSSGLWRKRRLLAVERDNGRTTRRQPLSPRAPA